MPSCIMHRIITISLSSTHAMNDSSSTDFLMYSVYVIMYLAKFFIFYAK